MTAGCSGGLSPRCAKTPTAPVQAGVVLFGAPTVNRSKTIEEQHLRGRTGHASGLLGTGSSGVFTSQYPPGLPLSQFMITRPPRVRPRSSLHTIIAVAVFFTLGLFVNEEYLSDGPHPAPPVASRTAPKAGPSDDEIYTGSILFTPHQGDMCRQFLFDNRTGRFTDNGNVDCERAEGIAPDYPNGRLWAISRGFH
jgi:hypothetical protein